MLYENLYDLHSWQAETCLEIAVDGGEEERSESVGVAAVEDAAVVLGRVQVSISCSGSGEYIFGPAISRLSSLSASFGLPRVAYMYILSSFLASCIGDLMLE